MSCYICLYELLEIKNDKSLSSLFLHRQAIGENRRLAQPSARPPYSSLVCDWPKARGPLKSALLLFGAVGRLFSKWSWSADRQIHSRPNREDFRKQEKTTRVTEHIVELSEGFSLTERDR